MYRGHILCLNIYRGNIYIYIYICIYIYMYIDRQATYIYIHICAYMDVYIHTYIYIYIHTCVVRSCKVLSASARVARLICEAVVSRFVVVRKTGGYQRANLILYDRGWLTPPSLTPGFDCDSLFSCVCVCAYVSSVCTCLFLSLASLCACVCVLARC